MKIILKNVRLAFPALFEAKTVNGEGEPAFSAAFLIDKADPQITAINKLMEQVGAEKWGAKWPTVKKELVAKDRTALHDGDAKADYAGFDGSMFISARSKTRQPVIDADKSPLVAADGKPYAGCYVNTSVEFWAMDNNYGRRICSSLGVVQFSKDGAAFGGGGVASTDDFDVLEGSTADDLA